jgi:hypothetical protein
MPPLEIILNYIFGSTTLVSIYIAWKSRNHELKKSEAQAKQEEVKSKKDLSDLEHQIYVRLSEELNSQLNIRSKKIKDLEETQQDMLLTIKLQVGNIKSLSKLVEDYRKTCDDCKFRKNQIV